MKKLLAVLFILLTIVSCKKDNETSNPDDNSLVTQIITPAGGSIETDEGLKITFPNGAVSVDTEVSLGFDGTEPTTFPNPNVSILGEVFSVKINANSLNETAILEIPKPTGYTNLDEIIVLISNGTTYFPLFFSEDSNKLVAQLDYINYTEVYNDALNNRNPNSISLVVFIIDLQTPPSNQLGLKKVDLDNNSNMTFSIVPDLDSTDKVLIMVHGWISDPSTWSSFLPIIDPLIEISGYTHYLTFGYNSGLSINDNGIILSDLLQTTTNGAKIDIVAHSMGGLVSRSAIEDHNCAGIVRNLITLGTPHKGAPKAVWRNLLGFIISIYNPIGAIFYNINTQGSRDLNTSSDFLDDLNENLAPTTNYYPISAIKDSEHREDGVVEESSALGIQNNNNLLLGETFDIPYADMPHTAMTNHNVIILHIAETLNTINYTPTEPTLTTNAIEYITPTSAISGGDITDNGGSTVIARGVCYSTTPNPTLADYSTDDGILAGFFTSVLNDLTANTTYYVRAYATNGFHTSYGGEIEFTTILDIPIISTTNISSITENTASSGGNVTSEGSSSVTEKGVCWSISPNPDIEINYTDFTTDGIGLGSYTSSLISLTENTTYYVRAYATNSEGTAYGNEIEFTTLASGNGSAPTVTTTAITAITQSTAISGGNVTNDGGNTVTAKGICYSTTPNPTTANNTTNDGTGMGVFTSSLTGLTESTTYYVRAYATNSEGTAYGDEKEFETECSGGIYTGSVSFDTQQEIDDFGSQCFSEITGTLQINSGSDILSLLPLLSITSIGGDLGIIDCDNLINLDGLSNVNFVGSRLQILFNEQLSNINALTNITSCNAIYIETNNSLINIDGISNISNNLGGELRIMYNNSLNNINGIPNITLVGADLVIAHNPNITNINSLSNITTVGDDLIITANSNITNLDGLSNIISVTNNLHFTDNTSLTDLCGIRPYLLLGTFTGNYNVSGNDYNPTQQDIIDGNCSQ